MSGTELTEWPHLNTRQMVMMVAVPIISWVLIWVWLRVIWPDHVSPLKKKAVSIEDPQLQKGARIVPQAAPEATEITPLRPKAGQVMEAGVIRGDYSAPWTSSFDLVFLICMVVALGLLSLATTLWQPSLWTNGKFWLLQLPKLAVMMAVSILGGKICRYFCETDEKGYIITNKGSKFKVNYTRKLQHFAAYAVPLVCKSPVHGPLALAWGDWFTMLAFLVLIKPVRERLSFFMLQFNSLDRPEDRPDTLKWIIAGNIFPGLCMIIFFRWCYSFSNQQGLAFIFIMITGIGDGLAEPVGITWGRHKYLTRSFLGGPKYQRSLEGSACLFLSSIIFCACFWYAFHNETEMWIAMAILAPLMTWAEATSPHTMDTPFLMGLGGLTLLLVSHLHILWV